MKHNRNMAMLGAMIALVGGGGLSCIAAPPLELARPPYLPYWFAGRKSFNPANSTVARDKRAARKLRSIKRQKAVGRN